MTRTQVESIILYGGLILLAYFALKSWGVIKSVSASSISSMKTNEKNSFDWKPLSNDELMNIRIYLDNYRSIDVVREV